MIRLLLIYILIFFAASLYAKDMAPTNAYLGIVGPGSGLGSFGHSFVVFGDANKSIFYEHETFSYVLKGLSHDTTPMDFVKKYYNSQLNFSIVKQELLSQVEYYTKSENRNINLIKLNLSNDQILKFYSLILKDYNNGKDGFKTSDYGLFNNCVTRPIELLNQVLPKDNPIPIIGLDDPSKLPKHIFKNILTPIKLLKYIKNGHLAHLPYAILEVLKDHSIYDGPAYIFDDEEINEKKLYQRMFTNISRIQNKCNINYKFTKLIKIKTAKFIREGNIHEYLPIHEYLLKKCIDKRILRIHTSYIRDFITTHKDPALYYAVDELYKGLK